MPWRLSFTRRGERDLAGLPERDREVIRRALDRLEGNLGSVDLRKLTGRPSEWAIRVGRWRVLLDLDNQGGLIIVTRVLPRKNAYRS